MGRGSRRRVCDWSGGQNPSDAVPVEISIVRLIHRTKKKNGSPVFFTGTHKKLKTIGIDIYILLGNNTFLI
jgi:hypothetical protein